LNVGGRTRNKQADDSAKPRMILFDDIIYLKEKIVFL
jgi:hypothetical protein